MNNRENQALALLEKMASRSRELMYCCSRSLADINSYNIVISMYANRSREYDAGSKAERILNQIMERNDVEVNFMSFQKTLLAYAKSHCGQDAERIIMKMIELYDQQQNSDDNEENQDSPSPCKPTVDSFNIVINAYANQGLGMGAEHIFDLMTDYDVQPDAASHTAVIRARENCLNTDKEASDKVDEWKWTRYVFLLMEWKY